MPTYRATRSHQRDECLSRQQRRSGLLRAGDLFDRRSFAGNVPGHRAGVGRPRQLVQKPRHDQRAMRSDKVTCGSLERGLVGIKANSSKLVEIVRLARLDGRPSA
jgi:hypothetical protein